MTVLSDADIRRALAEGRIGIDPKPDENQISTSALDLFLGDELFELKTAEELSEDEPPGVMKDLVIDPEKVDVGLLLGTYEKPIPKNKEGAFVLPPGKFVLGLTRESISLPLASRIAARVEGRSTLARLGLVVHLTAPTIHAGFRGRIALEMYNLGNYPLLLRPGTLAICQLIFEQVTGVPHDDLRTSYQDQKSVRKKRG